MISPQKVMFKNAEECNDKFHFTDLNVEKNIFIRKKNKKQRRNEMKALNK